MLIRELELYRFRNYESQHIEFENGINIIHGDNGEGKTNIIEAIYLLSIGRSFRTAKDREMINLAHETGYIKSRVESMGREFKIEYRISKSGKKAIKINGVPVDRLNQLLGIINVVIFSPEDLRLVKEGPRERRSFIDREISQIRPKYYQLLSVYHKNLLQRNNLLKNPAADRLLIDVYDSALAESGYRIMCYREEFINEIREIARKNHLSISSGKEILEIGYEKNVNAGSETEYMSILRESREKDIFRKTTSSGVHRDDLDIRINGIDLRSYGSQGQKRSAAISLKLSEIELIKNIRGEYPVVLLDDIFSELDPKRQHMLLETFKETQTFVTVAEEMDIETDNTKYRVKSGSIEKY